MGRFRVTDDASDISLEEYDHRKGWEFIGDPGEENSMIVRGQGGTRAAAANGSSIQQEPSIQLSRRRRRRRRSMDEWETVPYDDFLWRDQRFLAQSVTTPRRRTSYAFIWVSIFVIAVACLWKDPPPAPPRALGNDTTLSSWNDYLMIHIHDLKRSATALGIHVPKHILSWLASSVRADAQLWYEHYQLQRRTKQCQVQLYADLELDMVAQDLAVEWLSESVRVWNQEQPLVLLAVGYHYTGKRTLCDQLATRICSEKCPRTDFMLHIAGSVWEDDVLIDVVYRKLQDQIKTHTLNGGKIILLRQVEEMAPSLLKMLLEELSPECVPKHDNLCHFLKGSILYLTSSAIGLTSIARNLRVSGGTLRGTSSLAADLLEEAERHLGVPASSAITRILPFGPLTPEDLKKLLLRRVQEFSDTKHGIYWKRFNVTDKVMDLFLSKEQVDYLEWKSRPKANPKHDSDSLAMQTGSIEAHSQEVMTVSVEGARVLGDKGAIMSKIYAQVEQMLSKSTHHQNSKVAIMDIGTTTSLSGALGFQDIVVKWCDEQPDTSLLNCYEAHRFRV